MQSCPKCGRTYDSDTQKFCTHDGGRLSPGAQPTPDQGPTTYDLNQTVRTDPFDPEETVTRMPDLNKTVMSNPTTQIRKETGPAVPPQMPPQQMPAENPYQPQPPQAPQPPAQPPVNATVAFNQPPPLVQQPPPPPPPPAQQHQQQQPYYQPQPPHVQQPQQQPQHGQQYAPTPPVAMPHEQQHQQPPPQQAHHAPAGAARKSSKAPLIIGLVVVLLLGGAAAWYFLIYKKGNAGANSNVANSNAGANANANANTTANTNANANTTANANTGPAEEPPPPNSTKFVSSSSGLDGKLAETYSDFSFYYPSAWEKDPKSGVAGASNFVKVERRLPPDFTQENFSVTSYDSKGTYALDEEEVFPKMVETAKARYSKALPEFEVLSEGETEVNGIKGYELRFESVSRGTEKGDITLWGRLVFLPPGAEGKTHGLQLLMFTTSLAPELSGADDLGIKGELPMILKSFRMGKS